MKNSKKTIVIVGTLLITIIVIVGSVVTITKINKDDAPDYQMGPVMEMVINEKEAETIDVKLDVYEELVNGITRPPEVQEVLEISEETGETMYITDKGEVGVAIMPEEDTRTDEEILADLDNIWYEVNGVSKEEEKADMEDSNTNQQVADNTEKNNNNTTQITEEPIYQQSNDKNNTTPYDGMGGYDLGSLGIETPEDQEGKGSVGDDIYSDVTFQ